MKFDENKISKRYEEAKRVSFLYDNKIICVLWKEGVEISKEDAEHTMRYSLENYNTDSKLYPTYVDLTYISGMSRDAREVFQNSNTGTSSALALVVASTFSRVMGNIFTSMNQSGIPIKLFTDRVLAIEWLNEFVH